MEPLDILPDDSKERIRTAVAAFMDARVPGWREAPPTTYFVEPSYVENIGPIAIPDDGIYAMELVGNVVILDSKDRAAR